ncbi:MAG TPA: alpha/beta hydrolase [Allosphingosinicella sp.]|nr:alpha/beta hydrolase [Allosphingosinicella sp.]
MARFLPSPVAAFNRLVPKDFGSIRAAAGLAYDDGPRHLFDLYRPRRRSATGLPLLVFLYGGSWASGRRQDYEFAGRAFASRGFVVAVPDYRLVPEAHFPDFVADAAAAVTQAARIACDHGGDPRRIVLAGHSAGAYIAAMLALDPQWLGRARQAVRGFIGLAGPYDFLPLDGPATRAAFGRAEDLKATQPVRFAAPDSPPALLLHGAGDRTVRPRNSERLAAALAKAGEDARVKIYPRIGHSDILTALALPLRGRAPVLADSAAFAHEVCNDAAAL